MTQTDLLTRPDHTPTWKEFRKEWLRQGYHNKTESAKQAETQWKRLTNGKRIMAHKYAARFQTDFKAVNSRETTMLHCCRYLSQERFMNYEEEFEGEGPEMIVIKTGQPGYAEWIDHDPSIKTYGGFIVVPSPMPGDDQ